MKKEKSFDQPIWNNFYSKYMIIQNDGYCCLTQRNYVIVTMILIYTNLQLTMLFSDKFKTKNLKSTFHIKYYETVVPYYDFQFFFSTQTDDGMALIYLITQTSALLIFFLVHFLRSRFSFFGFMKLFGQCSMDVMVISNELFIVPQCEVCSKIFIRNIKGNFNFSIVYPFLSIAVVRVISIVVEYFTQDFKFYSERILSKKNQNAPGVKLFFLILITIAKNYHLQNERSEFLFLNLIFCSTLSIFLLYDEYIEDNYPSSYLCSFSYVSTLCFFAAETLFHIFSAFNEDFVSVIDIDLLLVSVFWIMVKIILELKKKRLFKFLKVDLFKEKDVKIVDRVCRILLQYNGDDERADFVNFILITVIKEHNRICKDKKCPCWSMVIKKVEKRTKMEMEMIKGIEEDDKVGLPSVIKSKKLREMLEKQRENAPTKIIMDSQKIAKFVEHIYLERSKVIYESNIILLSTITFLNDISNNHIRCLEKIFYLKQKITKKFKKLTINQTFVLENVRMILQEKFDKKKFKYSDLSFVVDSKHAVAFHLEIERLKNKMVDFSIKLRTFYKMLLKRVIDLKDLYSFIIDMVRMKKKFDLEFKRKFQVFRMNKELLINYYYYKHFLLFDDTHLKEYEDNIKNIFKYESTYKSGKIRFSNYQNLMSDSYVVILKLTEENILIDHVSPNCLDLFEVLNVEDLINKSINNFMPHNIARVHDNILVKIPNLIEISEELS